MREVMRAQSAWGRGLDAVISVLSPRWAAERAAWRMAERLAYKGSDFGRTTVARTVSGSADYHLEQGFDRDRMVGRARALERNNGIADGLLTRSTENVVGHGMRHQSTSADAAWNEKADDLFREWGDDCDVRGLDTFAELTALTYRSYQRDGDVGTILLDDGQLQSIESDQLADPPGKRGDRHFIDGVEINDRGRPVRFHVVDESKRNGPPISIQDRRSIPDRIAVDSSKFVYLARRKRLNQTRGEPAFAQSFWLFDQLDGNIEAVTMAARMAACFGLVIKRAGGMPGMPLTKGGNGKDYKNWSLEPAMVKTLEPGDEISQIQAQQPTQNFPDFVALLGRLLGLPLGLPLELVFMDFSRTSFSSARASLLQAYISFRTQQRRVIGHWCKPIRNWRIRKFIDDGQLPERADWMRHTWTPPGWQWIDPKAEVDSNLAAVDAGFKTLHDVAAEQGRDFAEILETRKKELEDLEAAGIPIVRSASTRDPGANMPGGAPRGGGQPGGGKPDGKPKPKKGGNPAPADPNDDEEDELTQAQMETLRAEMRAGLAEIRLASMQPSAHPPALPPPASPLAGITVQLMGDVKIPDGARFTLEPKEMQMLAPDQPTPIVNVTVSPTPVEVHAHNEVNVAPSAPTPIQVIATPGEVRVEHHVQVEAKLPAPKARKMVVKHSDGSEATATIN